MSEKYQSYDPQVIEKDLCSVFSPEWLEYAARETGLIKRERKIKSFIIFSTLEVGFCFPSVMENTSFWRYICNSEIAICPSLLRSASLLFNPFKSKLLVLYFCFYSLKK